MLVVPITMGVLAQLDMKILLTRPVQMYVRINDHTDKAAGQD